MRNTVSVADTVANFSLDTENRSRTSLCRSRPALLCRWADKLCYVSATCRKDAHTKVIMVELDTSLVRFTATWIGDGDKVATVVDATSQRGSRLRLPAVLADRCGLTWSLLFTRETDIAFCDLKLWYECACGVSLTPWQRCIALRVSDEAAILCKLSVSLCCSHLKFSVMMVGSTALNCCFCCLPSGCDLRLLQF